MGFPRAIGHGGRSGSGTGTGRRTRGKPSRSRRSSRDERVGKTGTNPWNEREGRLGPWKMFRVPTDPQGINFSLADGSARIARNRSRSTAGVCLYPYGYESVDVPRSWHDLAVRVLRGSSHGLPKSHRARRDVREPNGNGKANAGETQVV